MSFESNPNGVNNPKAEPEAVVSGAVCSAEFAEGCVEPIEDDQPEQAPLKDEEAASQAEEIHFSETVCSAEFQGGCIDPEDEAENA